ncbi:hypothetical protein ACI2LO_31620 [Streptomyces sp. NPDC033754]|uniref:hypothetical protein n=1 Tax=unclassified Streptomyces TaxID=2593676 RepID=UPI0033CD33D2
MSSGVVENTAAGTGAGASSGVPVDSCGGGELPGLATTVAPVGGAVGSVENLAAWEPTIFGWGVSDGGEQQ